MTRPIRYNNRAVAAGKVSEQIRHDEAFHRLVYEFSGNPLIAGSAESHWRFLRRVMGDVLRREETPRAIWRQHAEILDAIVGGDPDLAEQRVLDHARGAAGELVAADSSGARTDGGPGTPAGDRELRRASLSPGGRKRAR